MNSQFQLRPWFAYTNNKEKSLLFHKSSIIGRNIDKEKPKSCSVITTSVSFYLALILIPRQNRNLCGFKANLMVVSVWMQTSMKDADCITDYIGVCVYLEEFSSVVSLFLLSVCYLYSFHFTRMVGFKLNKYSKWHTWYKDIHTRNAFCYRTVLCRSNSNEHKQFECRLSSVTF